MEVDDLFDELEKAFDENVQNIPSNPPSESAKEIIGDVATTSTISDITLDIDTSLHIPTSLDIPTPMDIDDEMLFNIPLPPRTDEIILKNSLIEAVTTEELVEAIADSAKNLEKSDTNESHEEISETGEETKVLDDVSESEIIDETKKQNDEEKNSDIENTKNVYNVADIDDENISDVQESLNLNKEIVSKDMEDVIDDKVEKTADDLKTINLEDEENVVDKKDEETASDKDEDKNDDEDEEKIVDKDEAGIGDVDKNQIEENEGDKSNDTNEEMVDGSNVEKIDDVEEKQMDGSNEEKIDDVEEKQMDDKDDEKIHDVEERQINDKDEENIDNAKENKDEERIKDIEEKQSDDKNEEKVAETPIDLEDENVANEAEEPMILDEEQIVAKASDDPISMDDDKDETENIAKVSEETLDDDSDEKIESSSSIKLEKSSQLEELAADTVEEAKIGNQKEADGDKPKSPTNLKETETQMEIDDDKADEENKESDDPEIPDICSDKFPEDKDPVDISSDKSSDSTKPEGKATEEIASVTVDDVEDLAQNEESRDPIQEDSSDMTKTNDPEDNSVVNTVEDEEPMLVEADKFTLTHYNEEEERSCQMCEKTLLPKFIAQRENETLYICDNDCYTLFKEKHGDNIIEKLIRLRSFATQDKKIETQNVDNDEADEQEFEWEGDEEPKDTLRKCGTCKNNFDIDNYISWEAVDFCNEACLLAYQRTINSACQKCRKDVGEIMLGKFCVRFGNIITQFCSTTCLLSYKKTNKFCAYCQEDLRNNSGEFKNFCSKRCLDVCQPERPPNDCCAVCHQIKPVNVKIRNAGKVDQFCGEPCFVAYKFVNQVNPVRCEACPTYFEPNIDDPIIYTEGMTHMLCSKDCQKIYLITNRKIVVCRCCSVKKYDFDMVRLCENQKDIAFACSNTCLKACFEKTYDDQVEKSSESNVKQLESIIKHNDILIDGISLSDMVKISNQETKNAMHKITITKPRPYVKQRNVATMCKPNVYSKATNCMYRTVESHTQTDEHHNRYYLPVPVPIFVPMPCHMNVETIPMAVPIAIPLPVPIFIPTTRKSIAGITKEIQKIKNRVPADPLEAELLMMAEMAAGDKKQDSSSESETEDPVKSEEPFQAEVSMDASTSFGDDVLSMAFKMASNFEETTEVVETTPPTPVVDPVARIETVMEAKRKNIRQQASKAKRKTESSSQMGLDVEKPDVNLCLKYTFGVNAWKQWVTIKNQDLQKTQKRPKLFKPEILQLTADDLNFSLCLFVKEVRKPNGAEYAPDTIYYLCLGIQQYLYENGRIDNIFCDPFYEKFTDMFNEVCIKFAQLYNDSQYIVTRVEEEHLWESKQLGAHSPLVLLNTLMFFNTKHFSLTTVDEHLQLSFSHIMKHWKRNPSHPGSRNVLLRFYPPQSAGGGKKKKVYEQQENDENPLRCPVKLYEFYLSKCPESVKTRNDVFYLLPERSCVPDSPVWYSTMAMDKEPLEKMLNRVKMIKEINVALLTT